MARKILLLIMMSFSVAIGGFWALQAQDPMPKPVRPDARPTVAAQTTQMDLSGTYTGTFDCDALGLTGDTTLTITGNEFTTADGKTGRIVASTTGGYTAVAFQVGGTGTPAATTAATTTPTTPMIVSMRARKSGKRLTLTAAPGATMKCSFVPSRGIARSKRQKTPAATGTEVSNPANVPSAVPAESPMPAQTPSPVPSPSPQEPTPSPSPTPSGSPTPAPSPSPGEPTPSPSPSPTPTPTPTPRPAI